MVVVVIDNTEAVGEDPHLHGSVSAAGEDVIGWSHLDLHDASAEVPEQRLASVLIGEGVEWTLSGQAPNLWGPRKKTTVYVLKNKHGDAFKQNTFEENNLFPKTEQNKKNTGINRLHTPGFDPLPVKLKNNFLH